jgi:lincosamide nucleotidyltransferase
VTRAAEIVETVGRYCLADNRIRAALTYGSVPQGLDDEFSDAEFWVFPYERVDSHQWIGGIVEPLAVIDNEFGASVAFLSGGMRVEFHLQTDVTAVSGWASRGGLPVERMVLVDRDGGLTAALSDVPENAEIPPPDIVCGRFANWWLLGWNVLRRGEFERAYDAMSHVRWELLAMARLRRARTERWLTPSRMAERDLPAADIAALAGTTSTVDNQMPAYAAAWRLGTQWWRDLVAEPPEPLFTEIATLLERRPVRSVPLGWPSG